MCIPLVEKLYASNLCGDLLGQDSVSAGGNFFNFDVAHIVGGFEG
jgi:hypothetical protein